MPHFDSLAFDTPSFFRPDIPIATQKAITESLLSDPGILDAFSLDVRFFSNGLVLRDLLVHLRTHVGGFLNAAGVPAFDLGLWFWLGNDLEIARRALEEEIKLALSGRRAYSNRAIGDPDFTELADATFRFIEILQGIDRTAPIPKLVALNPQPPPTSHSWGESRFSFFTHFLPFHLERTSLLETYARRTRFYVHVMRQGIETAADIERKRLLAGLLPNRLEGPEWQEERAWIRDVKERVHEFYRRIGDRTLRTSGRTERAVVPPARLRA